MMDREEGFTLIETLVAIGLFAVISIGFYQVLFSATRGSERARDVAITSGEARQGLNRLVRDVREGSSIEIPAGQTVLSNRSFKIEVDFDGDGDIAPTPSEPLGNYEALTFTFTEAADGNGTISVTAGTTTEVLVRGVDCIRRTNGTCRSVFTYGSSRLEWDLNSDGVTDATELDTVLAGGNNNGSLDGSEPNRIDLVTVGLVITAGETSETFYAEAQLRNRR